MHCIDGRRLNSRRDDSDSTEEGPEGPLDNDKPLARPATDAVGSAEPGAQDFELSELPVPHHDELDSSESEHKSDSSYAPPSSDSKAAFSESTSGSDKDGDGDDGTDSDIEVGVAHRDDKSEARDGSGSGGGRKAQAQAQAASTHKATWRRRPGVNVGAGKGASDIVRGTRYGGCNCTGVGNVLYNPFENYLFLVATRTAHQGRHPAIITMVMPDVPADAGSKLLITVSILNSSSESSHCMVFASSALTLYWCMLFAPLLPVCVHNYDSEADRPPRPSE